MAKNQGQQINPLQYLPSPKAEAQAYIMQLEAQARIQQQQEERQRAQAEQDRLQQIARTQDLTQQAYNTAQNYGTNRLNTLGIADNYGIMDAYRNELDYAKSLVPQISDAPGSYINAPTIWDSVYGSAKSRERNKLLSGFNDFAGSDFALGYIPDTMDDSILSSILGTQRDDAQYALDAARARGKLDDSGYNRGLTELENMFKSAFARANDIGGGVLSGYRNQLSSKADNYRNDINNFDFTTGFDLDKARTGLEGLASSFGGRLEGDILSAIGDTSFFDTAKLIGKAGLRNGATNPALAGTTGLGATNTNNTLNDPTLGSAGVF